MFERCENLQKQRRAVDCEVQKNGGTSTDFARTCRTARKIWVKMGLPFQYEVIAESMWRTVGWGHTGVFTCHNHAAHTPQYKTQHTTTTRPQHHTTTLHTTTHLNMPQHPTTTRPQHHTETETERDREKAEKEREKRRRKRRDKTSRNRREEKKTKKKRRVRR